MKMQLSSSINEYLNKEEYLIKTLAQIRRDFEMSGSTFEGEFNEMINYQALLNLVYENIYSFFQGNSPFCLPPGALEPLPESRWVSSRVESMIEVLKQYQQ